MIRDVTFLLPQTFNAWSQVKTAGTVVLSNSNRTATINNTDALRTYLHINANVTIGHWYYFSVFVDSAAAEFDTTTYGDAQLMIYEGVAGGEQFYPITSIDNGRRVGILFQALSTKSERFRVGVGAVGNREAGQLVITDPVVYSYGATQPALVDKFYSVGAQTFPYTIQTSKAAASVYTAGVITENAATNTVIDPSQVILCTGDSYGMNDRYPVYLQAETGGIVYNRHVGGENLEEIRDRLASDLAGDFWPVDMLELYSAPKTLIIEGGGNSALENLDATVILGLMDDCLDLAQAANIQRIVIVNLPPFLNYASYTQSKAFKALGYNALLGSRYRNYPVYDLYNAVKGDVAAGETFSASGSSWTMHPLSKIAAGDTWDYDIGDGLHPSTAASQKIGSELAALLSAYSVTTAVIGVVSRNLATRSLVTRSLVTRSLVSR